MKRFASLFCALFLVLVAVEAQAEDKEGVLIVAFGTSMESAMPSLNDIDAAYKAAYPGKPQTSSAKSSRRKAKKSSPSTKP